jgi:outer membrane protein OmpA-like peptidoglycan-associated protein
MKKIYTAMFVLLFSTGVSQGQESDFGIYSNFTFVPGSKLLFYDDFGKDAVGDFPAQWETGGSGEVVTTNQSEGNWLSLQRRSGYFPSIKAELPENYTIEFDLITNGFGTPSSGSSKLYLAFLPKKAYSMGQAGSVADVELLLAKEIRVNNVENFGSEAEVRIANRIERILENASKSTTHISIAVNKKRLRVWFDQEKLVDSPNLLQGKLSKYFLIEARDILPEKKQFAGISNFRIAESTEDLRSQLINKGKFSTTGIYFETGSSNVKKESYGILKDIASLLTENQDIKLQIVGHTDSQGDDVANLQLSENRAESVKNILANQFKIAVERFETSGKGETEPVDDNSTETGRANNRRVEFIKLSK